MSWHSNFGDFGAVATAVGVAVGAYQLRVGRRGAQTQFEDSLTREYRGIAARLPVTAFLGVGMDEAEVLTNLDYFYRYIDLCNEQAFLHSKQRVNDETWRQWEDGIKSNLGRSGFGRAYAIIASLAPTDFDELRNVVKPDDIPEDERASLVATLTGHGSGLREGTARTSSDAN